MDYKNKVILAPMVRIGTLPLRLLSLDYGADIVYSEELIDYKLVQCKRVENPVLGTIDYVWSDGSIIYRTCPQEKGRVVLQIGTADANRAVRAAKLFENDVCAIDVNMGCPKEFSIKGGMGAALLKEPQKVQEILTTLVKAVSIPVTCKIRLLDTLEETMEFVRMVEQTGISAIGIHGRRKEERPRHDNHNDLIKQIAAVTKIPVIANGGSTEIFTYGDIETFRQATGADSVMIARQAQWNPSIFRAEGLIPIDDVVKAYLKYAVDYQSNESNVKYCLQNMLHDRLETPLGKTLLSAINVRDICSLWNMEDYFDNVTQQQKQKEAELNVMSGETSAFKRRKLDDDSEIVEMAFKYQRKEYPDTSGPKMILYNWTKKNSLPNARYLTTQHAEDRTFRSVCHVDGKKFGSTWWEKSKKCSEQAAAAVCLLYMGMSDGRRDRNANGSEALHKPGQKAMVDNQNLSEDPSSTNELNKKSQVGAPNEEPVSDNLSGASQTQKSCPEDHGGGDQLSSPRDGSKNQNTAKS